MGKIEIKGNDKHQTHYSNYFRARKGHGYSLSLVVGQLLILLVTVLFCMSEIFLRKKKIVSLLLWMRLPSRA